MTVMESQYGNNWFVNQQGNLYLLKSDETQTTICKFNQETEKEEKLFGFVHTKKQPDPTNCLSSDREVTQSFAVDSSGETIFVLIARHQRAEVRNYAPDGTLHTSWTVTPDPLTPFASISSLLIDGHSTLYLIHSASISPMESAPGSIILYDAKGKEIKRVKDKVGSFGSIAVDSQGNIYAIKLMHHGIYKYNAQGAFIVKWNALPPEKGETWALRKENTEKASSLSKDSPTEDVVKALIYGDYKVYEKARAILQAKEPSALLVIMQYLKSHPGNYYLMKAAEELIMLHQEKALIIIKEAFLKENEQGKKALAALVAPFLKDQIPEITELINIMEREKDKQGSFAIDSVPLEEATIKQYLDEISDGRNINQEIKLLLHIHDAYPILKKILLDPQNPKREIARALLVGGDYYGDRRITCKKDFSASTQYAHMYLHHEPWPKDPVIQEQVPEFKDLKELASSADLYVRDTAVVILALNGIPGYEGEIVKAALRDSRLQPFAMASFQLLAYVDKDKVIPFVPDLFNIIESMRTSGKLLAKEDRVRIREKGDRKAFDAVISNKMQFDDMLKSLIYTGIDELCRKVVLYLADPDLDDGAKMAVLVNLQEPKHRYLAPEMISLIDAPVSVATLELVVRNLESYKANKALPRLLELYKREQDLQKKYTKTDKIDTQDDEGWEWDEQEWEHENLLRTLLSAIGSFKDKSVLPLLATTFTESTKCDIEIAALSGIASIGADAATAPLLEPLLVHDDFKLYAAIALAKRGDQRALPIIIEALKTDFFAMRYVDASAFIPLGEPAINELMTLLDYPYEPISAFAANTLARIKIKQATPKIKAMLLNEALDFSHNESLLIDALLIAGEDPFPLSMKRHGKDFVPVIEYDLERLQEKNLASKVLSTYLAPNKKSEEAYMGLFLLWKLHTPEATDILKKYTPPADERIKKLLAEALKCE